MSRATRYLIVGASLAGLSAAETLRKEGFEGEVLMVGEEPVLPYDRPPLSKQILRGEWEPERTFLRDDTHHQGLDIEWRLGQRATALDLDYRRVTLDGGESVGFDGLVIATGARARPFPGSVGLGGVHVLRTLDDALALRADLEKGPRVCVVGAGFIGTEVAAACRARGLDVTVLANLSAPLASVLPPKLAWACGALHLDQGVNLRCGVDVVGFDGRNRVEAVRLADGQTVPADVVVVGIGATPETGWLVTSGLAIDSGVLCDATLATSAPGVVAAGDVARWPNAVFSETMRVEHWTNALEQGAAAARRLLHGEEATRPFTPVPYVWSDQYETMVQIMGRVMPDDDVHMISGSTEEGKFVAVTVRAGRIVGAVAFNEPRLLRAWRDPIATRTAWDEVVSQPGST